MKPNVALYFSTGI